MNFASLRLVLHSTGVAARVLHALATAHPAIPGDHAAVNDTLRSISVALQAVDRSMPFHPPPVLPSQDPAALVEAAAEVTGEGSYPHAPVLLEQEINGCKTLLLEVVRRAAYDWVLYRTSRRMIQRKLAEDAYTWLFVEEPGHTNWIERAKQGKHITSFLAICSELDLDADTVRSYVRRLTVKNVMSVGRPAEYRRRESSPPSLDEESMPGLSIHLARGLERAFATGTDAF